MTVAPLAQKLGARCALTWVLVPPSHTQAKRRPAALFVFWLSFDALFSHARAESLKRVPAVLNVVLCRLFHCTINNAKSGVYYIHRPATCLQRVKEGMSVVIKLAPSEERARNHCLDVVFMRGVMETLFEEPQHRRAVNSCKNSSFIYVRTVLRPVDRASSATCKCRRCWKYSA